MMRRIAPLGRMVMGPRMKLARDLGLLWAGQVLTKGITFIAFAVLARRLMPQEYGAVEYALGLAVLALLAIDGGLGSVGVRRLTQGHQRADELVALIPAAQLCLAAIIAPGMILFTLLFARDPDVLPLTCAVAFSVLILPWKQDWLFQARGLMSHIVIGQLVRVISFVLGIVLFARADTPVLRVGLVEICSVALATLYMMSVQHLRVEPLRIRFTLAKLVDLWREGISIGLGSICWAMFQYAPLLMLAAMAGMTETAYFGAAHRLGVSLVTFSWIYHFNLYPVIARRVHGDPAALARLTRASIRATSWAGIALALVLTLIAKPLLSILFGQKFGAAAVPFGILVWTFPLTLLSGHARWILIAAKHGHDMLIAQMAGVAVAIPAAWLLIGRFGAEGAAMAMTLASIVVWVVSQFYAHLRDHQVPVLPAVAPMAAAGAIIAASAALALNPWLASALGLMLFGLAGLVCDRHLIADVRRLATGSPPPGAKPATMTSHVEPAAIATDARHSPR